MRLIVVEDDPAIRTLMRWFLEAFGVEVELVDSGEATVDAMERGWPDVIILDWFLQDEDGRSVLGRIQERFNMAPPVLVLSGALGAERQIEGVPRAVFVSKPFRVADFLAALSELTGDSAWIRLTEEPSQPERLPGSKVA